MRRPALSVVLLLAAAVPCSRPRPASALPLQDPAAATLGGPLPTPLPLFPSDNWWNVDITNAPVDTNSAAFISFIGTTRKLHADFGGEVTPGSVDIYGIPYAVVDGTQAKKAVTFQYSDESDGVDHATNQSFPFYPIPDEAITQAHWLEGGPPGNVDLRSSSDRHLLIVDRDNKHLYELWNVFYDGARWQAGSGAFFDMKTNNRRPDGWTSADAAGLAILPGLVRYDEAYGPDEIGHAFRLTLRASNGYVYPASHAAGSNPSALPMGARLRLKAGKDISTLSAPMQKIFRAMKKYGLIMADNGSDMYITGTFDTRWDSDAVNAAFGGLMASDFDVVQRGYVAPLLPSLSIDDRGVAEGSAVNAAFRVTLSAASSQTVTVQYASANGTAIASSDYTSASGTLSFSPGRTQHSIFVPIVSDTTPEGNETFFVNLSSPTNATLGAKSQGVGTIADPPAAAKIAMYRSYNKSTDYHFFTTDLNSKNFAVGTLGFQDESNPIPFYVWNVQQTGTTPLFRMYNPNLGRHFYTASSASRDFIMSIGGLYEKEEGFVFPLSTSPVPSGATELFLLYNNNSGTHLFTADANQKNAILNLFPGVWVQHTSVGFVFTAP